MNTLRIFDEWSTYEKVVANDYMHHRGFFDALIDQVGGRFDQALSIIDIGCGDGQPMIALLERFRIERYVGIDQSETALERARLVLAATGVKFDLRKGSMLEELTRLDGEFDLAIAAYSLHHLNSEQKIITLSQCRRLLRPQGILAVIDVFLEDGESRANFIERWQENASRAFTALTPAELEALLEHVRGNDYPETLSAYRRIGKSAGFDTVNSISQDPERLNKLVVFL